MKTQHCAMCIMNHVYKRKNIFVENVGGIDRPLTCEDVTTSNSNMKSVYIKLGTHWKMKYCSMQLYKFKLYFGNHTNLFQFIGVFFCCEWRLHMDLENLQMLQCIVCDKKIEGSVLSQSCILRKGLIECNKINGIIPMKTHVDIAHPRLFVQKRCNL